MIISSIAENTFRETIRDRVLYSILFFALGMIVLSFVVSRWSIGQEVKILKDFGLSVMSIFGLLISIFIGIGLVYKEIEKKTIYVIISKPIHRYQFILGKYFGLILTLLVNIIIMSIFLYFILYVFEREFDLLLLKGIFMIYFEMVFVLAFAILFSSFTTPILSAFLTMFIYIGGHFSADIKLLGPGIENKFFEIFLNILHYVLPNLEYFNIKTSIVHHLPVSTVSLIFSVLYGFLYISIILLLSVFIFQKRDLK
jgi:ABC-type transport system involved in multi-copper enzyme maturation permease subunit